MDQLLFYIKEGFYHVLDWRAYDHILFLIVLCVVYTFDSLKRVFLLISLFTIGHTFSLILATYGVLTIKASVVEFLIPITIFITAWINIITLKTSSRNSGVNLNLFLALFFGLIHGLGFSRGFKMLVGREDDLFLPLLEFALGIEFAQLIVTFIILLLGFVFCSFLRFSKRDWVLVSSAIVVGLVIPMLLNSKFW
ncbi:MAG: HupE/UreJ family protein [Flavobacteriaceae bacterium]|nr:HupE/UreJ family protein [Flavobacteriaceae bacterium]